MGRHKGNVPERTRRMLSPGNLRKLIAGLAATANVSEASRRVGITRHLAYNWRRRSEAGDPLFMVQLGSGDDEADLIPFHEAWEDALEVATDHLEAVAVELATGYQEVLTHKGEISLRHCPVLDELVPVTITKYDSRMLEILLKARRPEKYRERFEHRHSGEVGGVLLVPGIAANREDWETAAKEQQAVNRGEERPMIDITPDRDDEVAAVPVEEHDDDPLL